MFEHPDFVVTVGGRDVTKDCIEWEVLDAEKEMSRINCTIANIDEKYSGLGNEGDDLQIRFGTENNLGPKATLPVKEVEESNGREPLVRISAQDRQEKMCGGRSRGNFKEGMTPRDIEKEVAQAYQLTVDGKGDGPKLEDGQRHAAFNEKAADLIYRMQRMKKGEGGGSGGGSPSSQMKGGGGKPSGFEGTDCDVGDLLSGNAMQGFKPDDGKKVDGARAGNANKNASGEQCTGRIELRGCPELKAKQNVTIMGVGSRFSGAWYVKQARHHWKIGGGYLTTAELIRGGTGEGKSSGEAPMVCYADIWSEGGKKVYMGPRKTEGGQGPTFTWGRGDKLISYSFRIDTQPQRGAGEKGTGKANGVNFKKKGEPFEAKGSGDSGGGGGGK